MQSIFALFNDTMKLGFVDFLHFGGNVRKYSSYTLPVSGKIRSHGINEIH